jgi:hypothetical protein
VAARFALTTGYPLAAPAGATQVLLVHMVARDRPIYRVIFLIVVAPIGAVVTVASLLLFGFEPHKVFWVGFVVKSWLRAVGLPAPNAVGVLSTVFLWWAVIAVLGLAWERFRRRAT